MTTFYKIIKSPVGALTLLSTHHHLQAVLWEDERPNRVKIEKPSRDDHHPILTEAEKQLNEYFFSGRESFKLPLPRALPGTHFQTKVWSALLMIPYGKTLTYQDIAYQIGSPNACRAVGTANGKNPLSIIIPCHRVIGKSGSLTGFAGGLKNKDYLLKLERLKAHLKN